MLPVARAQLVGLQRVEHPQHLVDVAADGTGGHRDELDLVVRVDDEGRRAARRRPRRGRRSASVSSRLMSASIGNGRSCRSSWSLRHARWTNSLSSSAEDLGVAVGELVVQLAERGDLGRAHEGEVLGPEEHDPPLARVGLVVDLLERLVRSEGDAGGQFELGELVTDGEQRALLARRNAQFRADIPELLVLINTATSRVASRKPCGGGPSPPQPLGSTDPMSSPGRWGRHVHDYAHAQYSRGRSRLRRPRFAAARRRPPTARHDRPAHGRQRLQRAGLALPRSHRGHLRPARPRPQHPQGRPRRQRAEVQAADVHAVIKALGAGPVEMFASSGGAVTALALVAAYPDDVTTLVAHEPPLVSGAPRRRRCRACPCRRPRRVRGQGLGRRHGGFIAMTSWQGEFTDDYFAQPAPDPGRVRDAQPRTTAPGTTRCFRSVLGGQQLPPRRRRAGRGADPGRDRRRRGVRGHVHRTHRGGHRRAARPAGDRVPEPPRRLPRRRVRYAGPPEAFARKLREVLDDAG